MGGAPAPLRRPRAVTTAPSLLSSQASGGAAPRVGDTTRPKVTTSLPSAHRETVVVRPSTERRGTLTAILPKSSRPEERCRRSREVSRRISCRRHDRSTPGPRAISRDFAPAIAPVDRAVDGSAWPPSARPGSPADPAVRNPSPHRDPPHIPTRTADATRHLTRDCSLIASGPLPRATLRAASRSPFGAVGRATIGQHFNTMAGPAQVSDRERGHDGQQPIELGRWPDRAANGERHVRFLV